MSPAERAVRDAAQKRFGILRTTFAQIAPELMTQIRARGAAGQQVRVFLQVAGEHRQRLLPAFGKRDHLFDAVRPVRFAAKMIEDRF